MKTVVPSPDTVNLSAPDHSSRDPAAAIQYFAAALDYSFGRMRLRLLHARHHLQLLYHAVPRSLKATRPDEVTLSEGLLDVLEKRLAALQDSRQIAMDAAIRAAHLGKLDPAAELLEQDRAVFRAQALRLRTPFDDLLEELSGLLRTLARALEGLVIVDSGRPLSIEKDAALRRTRSEGFEQLMVQIRKLPGQEHVLLPVPFAKLREAVSGGPVVVLLAGLEECRAIVIGSHEPPLHGRLPAANRKNFALIPSLLRRFYSQKIPSCFLSRAPPSQFVKRCAVSSGKPDISRLRPSRVSNKG
ncbi:hypothetical protein PUNSTDRAFT_137869 [Punctularia strigosozonata HHB-11173 SS5]|uniref:Uncharacterized protein n=1 Tax=Punctularia strigosozonata (strain HHB-11173) TaxID=741275 RepID=R7S5G2_PUNST|nr:uncharacterized protein PUNSTDRAFT_137869 [Punctularia strigosozonata HHB-11173 SS5]EIN05187.1 hypothetical protein PUNSTDRAFT_137869 [Punctularia strigosozonata HHB-11173 SS5]